MKNVNLSEQSLNLLDIILAYTDNTRILHEVADSLYYDVSKLKRELAQLKEEVGL